MSDYIDRQAAIDKLKKWSDGYRYIEVETEYAINQFKAMPSADVEPVRHGHWIKMSDSDGVYWACSECGEDIPRVSHFNPQFDLFPRYESIDKTTYCPNCGARMGGEQDG